SNRFKNDLLFKPRWGYDPGKLRATPDLLISKPVNIRPIFEAKFDSNVAFLQNIKEQIDEEESRALRRINETPVEKAAKRKKLDEEVPVVDYEIINQNNKPYYKIKRDDDSHKLYLSFLSLLRNFEREDLKALWSLVKERFATTKTKNVFDDFLLITLGAMFEKPDDDMAPDAQAQSSDDEDIRNAYIPKKNWASALASTYLPPPKDSLLAQTGDIAMFMDWLCKRKGITKLKPQDVEGPAFELVKVFHPNVIHLQYQMEECHKLLTDSMDDSILKHNVNKPLPLGGPPGQVTIQSDIFFNKDLEYLRYGSKASKPALSISKMKAAYYLDVGLEQMVTDQMWIEEECKYDIAAMYGISHWWFQRQQFYIDRHTSEGDRRAVRTHMQILSVVIIEVFSIYGYDYMKKIVLRLANLNEHIIVKRDFKYLYPSDFEDLYLLNLQGHLNHLPPKDKKILTTAVNL
nr:hypothetical protein [Tanacetum cinerariifolium]